MIISVSLNLILSPSGIRTSMCVTSLVSVLYESDFRSWKWEAQFSFVTIRFWPVLLTVYTFIQKYHMSRTLGPDHFKFNLLYCTAGACIYSWMASLSVFFLLCCVFVYCLKNMNSNKWQQQTEHLVRLFLCVPCESQIQTSDMALLLLLLLYILRLYIATLLLILILSLLLLFTLCNGLERLLYVNESFWQ